MTLRIIATGGTFDKHYDALTGELTFASSHLPDIIKRCRLTVPVTVIEELPLLDSLDMQDVDRERVLASCLKSEERAIVVVHGTDTMSNTAALLGPKMVGIQVDRRADGRHGPLRGARIRCDVQPWFCVRRQPDAKARRVHRHERPGI